ncbi:MAG TPA: hypothetical protein ENK14_07860 [Caldithrix sp.]|nr:hypothetical protein [Caldithrix sp.]
MKTKFLILILTILSGLMIAAFPVSAGEKQVELKFSHKLHVLENDLECTTCHETAKESKAGSANLLPTMETCGNCHDVESDENCKMCHSDPENPRSVPRIESYSELFSHEKHLATGMTCISCHQEVTQLEQPQPYLLPTMTICINCHQLKKANISCNTCHKPGENLKPVTHGINFIHAHGDLAKSSAAVGPKEKNCNLCHRVSFCQDCHEGDNLDRRSHPLNYAYTHSLDALGKERECSTCHTERAFCIECHQQNLVMPHNHTLGWAIPNVGGRHREVAETDLENCMGCHTEQDAEITCQKSGCHPSK